jgi:hypothetical protein
MGWPYPNRKRVQIIISKFPMWKHVQKPIRKVIGLDSVKKIGLAMSQTGQAGFVRLELYSRPTKQPGQVPNQPGWFGNGYFRGTDLAGSQTDQAGFVTGRSGSHSGAQGEPTCPDSWWLGWFGGAECCSFILLLPNFGARFQIFSMTISSLGT